MSFAAVERGSHRSGAREWKCRCDRAKINGSGWGEMNKISSWMTLMCIHYFMPFYCCYRSDGVTGQTNSLSMMVLARRRPRRWLIRTRCAKNPTARQGNSQRPDCIIDFHRIQLVPNPTASWNERGMDLWRLQPAYSPLNDIDSSRLLTEAR